MIGAGIYCDNRAGAAVATGDGEEILRTCISFHVVENMRMGCSPRLACRKGIERLEEIVSRHRLGGGDDASGDASGGERMHEKLTVAVMAMNTSGDVGAASTLGPQNPHRGRPVFPMAVWRHGETVRVSHENDEMLRTKTTTGV